MRADEFRQISELARFQETFHYSHSRAEFGYAYSSRVARTRTLVPSDQKFAKDMSSLAACGLLAKLPGLTLLPASSLMGTFVSPVILPKLAKVNRSFWLLSVLAIACLPFGLAMRWISSTRQLDGASLSNSLSILIWVTAFTTIPALGLYLAQVANFRRILWAALVGALTSALLNSPAVEWKGDVGIYATALVLALSAGRNRNWSRATLLVSVALSAQYDARGQALFALITLGFTFITRHRAQKVAAHPFLSVVGIGAVVSSAGLLIYRAMLAGYLGEAAQLRTFQQSVNGNPILGARVEWAAAGETFKFSPWGYGTGTITPASVQSKAVQAVDYAGGDYTSNYFTVDVLGDRHDFHSTLVNLWFHFGLAGVALAATMIFIMIVTVPKALDRLSTIGTLALYVISMALWDLIFSPMADIDRITTTLFICAAIQSGLAWPRTGRRAIRPLDGRPETKAKRSSIFGEQLANNGPNGSDK